MLRNRIAAQTAGLALVAAVLAGPAGATVPQDSGRSPGAIGAGATAVSSQSLIPATRSPGAMGAGATAVSSQSLIHQLRPGEVTGGTTGSPTLQVVHVTKPGGFDWGDAGIGAGTALLLALAGAGTAVAVGRRRDHHAGSRSEPLAG